MLPWHCRGRLHCLLAAGNSSPPDVWLPLRPLSPSPAFPQMATRDFTLSELAAPVGDDTHTFFLIPVADLINHHDSPNVQRSGEGSAPGNVSGSSSREYAALPSGRA